MKNEIAKIYAKIMNLETEVHSLQQGYVTLNQQYAAAVSGLHTLTTTALEASKRAAIAAEKALSAARNSAKAALFAASKDVIEAAEAAADAAAASAEASIEAAAAASAAAATASRWAPSPRGYVVTATSLFFKLC